jgi:hypothetical protein
VRRGWAGLFAHDDDCVLHATSLKPFSLLLLVRRAGGLKNPLVRVFHAFVNVYVNVYVDDDVHVDLDVNRFALSGNLFTSKRDFSSEGLRRKQIELRDTRT